jgi:two-component system sensor histidine kinase HydH
MVVVSVAVTFVVRGYFSSEQDLQDIKVLSTDIFASMDAGVITTDLNGNITSINPRGIELVGLDEDRNFKYSSARHGTCHVGFDL